MDAKALELKSKIPGSIIVKKERIKWMPYWFIAPSVLLIVAFLFYPMLNVFYYSMQNYNPGKPYYNGFAGFSNFVNVFTNDPLFWHSLRISLKWVTSEVVLQLVFGLMIALVLNQSFRFRSFFVQLPLSLGLYPVL